MDTSPTSAGPPDHPQPRRRLKLDAETATVGVGITAVGVCCSTAVAGPWLGVATAGVLGGLAWFAPPLAIAAVAGVVLLLSRGRSVRARFRRRA